MNPTVYEHRPDLHSSVRFNDASAVRRLLKRGFCANHVNITDESPLMIAVEKNNVGIVRLLLEAGGDVLRKNATGRSALSLAANDRRVSDEVLVLVLESLRKQCDGKSEEIAKRLLDTCCRVDQAAFLKDFRIIDHMMKRDVSIGSRYWKMPWYPRMGERMALHVATRLEDVETVKLLVESDAGLCRAWDGEKATALNYVYRGDVEHGWRKVEILKVLLGEGGASPTECTRSGEFQVGPTLLKGDYRKIRVLLESGIDCGATDEKNKRTVLHYLAVNANSGDAEELEAYIGRCELNTTDKLGNSPLHLAAIAGNAAMVKLLLEHGAEVDRTRGAYKFTPLMQVYVASGRGFEKRYDKCAKMLLEHDADPQLTFHKGDAEGTVFDLVKRRRQMKPVVARLALGEVTDLTRLEVDSRPSVKKYLKRCQGMLKKNVSGEITIKNLLTSNRRKLARLVSQDKSLRRAKYLKYRRKLKKNYSYYYDCVKRRLSAISWYVKSQDKVRAVLCELLGGRVDSPKIIVDKLVDYLDDRSLRNLYKISRTSGLAK